MGTNSDGIREALFLGCTKRNYGQGGQRLATSVAFEPSGHGPAEQHRLNRSKMTLAV